MFMRFIRSPWPWFGIATLILALYFAGGSLQRSGDGDPRPLGGADDIENLAARDDLNVLFILIDTLRADRLSCYGYGRKTSPMIDFLAERGVRFARHLAQSSWTKCSMASMWTGLYPSRTAVTRFDDVLPPSATLPAEILSDAGFRTAGIFRNGWVEGYFGFDQGFEIYIRPPGQSLPPEVRRDNPTLKGGGSDGDAVRAAEEFLRVHGRERWFLYLHLMDIHEYLYDEDTAVFGTTYSDVYDNAILRTNVILAGLYEMLAQQGYLENTLIVLVSDHGEAFGERGFEGHARNVHREVTEVPLILSFPFRLEEPVVVAERTANVDLWPTLLDLLGLPAMEESDGRSRLPEILAAARGEASPAPAEPVYAHLDQSWGQREAQPAPTVAVEDQGLRYIMFKGPKGTVDDQLFDRNGDRLEKRDVASERPDDVDRLRALAESYLERETPYEAPEKLELDEMQLNQLRALGYAVP